MAKLAEKELRESGWSRRTCPCTPSPAREGRRRRGSWRAGTSRPGPRAGPPPLAGPAVPRRAARRAGADHRVVRGVDGEGRYEDESQCRGEGQRQPRREQAREDADQCRAEHEGELVGGALIGQGGVQVSGVCGRPRRGSGRSAPSSGPGPADRPAGSCPGHEGRGQHGDGGGEVLRPGMRYAAKIRATMATVLAMADTSRTRRWPSRSARTPRTGAPSAEPMPTAPAAAPPTA